MCCRKKMQGILKFQTLDGRFLSWWWGITNSLSIPSPQSLPFRASIIYLISFLYRFIYTGSVDVTLDIAQDLLRAADQYLLEGLKRLCEYTIAQVSQKGCLEIFESFCCFKIETWHLILFSVFIQGYIAGKCFKHVWTLRSLPCYIIEAHLHFVYLGEFR